MMFIYQKCVCITVKNRKIFLPFPVSEFFGLFSGILCGFSVAVGLEILLANTPAVLNPVEKKFPLILSY